MPGWEKAEYRKRQSLYTKKLWAEGKYNFLRRLPVIKGCKNPVCNNNFQVKPYDPKKYCSQSCAAKVNNNLYIKRLVLKNCKNCRQKLHASARIYCSVFCQNQFQYSDFIRKWKTGLISGNKGITTKILSAHIKRYLRGKYGERCSLCGWNQKHFLTGRIPIEIDHIDGNADNNKEENLRLICPNCHSLTPSFRNLNKGKGRAWRLTYIANSKLVSKIS